VKGGRRERERRREEEGDGRDRPLSQIPGSAPDDVSMLTYLCFEAGAGETIPAKS